jgi:hypothetical protein
MSYQAFSAQATRTGNRAGLLAKAFTRLTSAGETAWHAVG